MRLPFVMMAVLVAALSLWLQAVANSFDAADEAAQLIAQAQPGDNVPRDNTPGPAGNNANSGNAADNNGITARLGETHTTVPSWVVAILPGKSDASITFDPLARSTVQLAWRVIRFPADFQGLRVSMLVSRRVQHRDEPLATIPLDLPADASVQITRWVPRAPGQYSFRLRLEPTSMPSERENVAESSVHNVVVLAPPPDEVRIAMLQSVMVRTRLVPAAGAGEQMAEVDVLMVFATASTGVALASEGRYQRPNVENLMSAPWAAVLPAQGVWQNRLSAGTDGAPGDSRELLVHRTFRFSRATWPSELAMRVLQLADGSGREAELAVLTLDVTPYPALVVTPRLVAPLQPGVVPEVQVAAER
ncbi:MAG: hypothetical protein AB7K09_11915 [Planctomycetota bacterium]